MDICETNGSPYIFSGRMGTGSATWHNERKHNGVCKLNCTIYGQKVCGQSRPYDHTSVLDPAGGLTSGAKTETRRVEAMVSASLVRLWHMGRIFFLQVSTNIWLRSVSFLLQSMCSNLILRRKLKRLFYEFLATFKCLNKENCPFFISFKE